MDDRTLTCPNCGSAVLPSARFCVTCGIRLPESGSDAAPPAGSGWNQPGEDVWIAEGSAINGESEGALADTRPDEAPMNANEIAIPESREEEASDTSAEPAIAGEDATTAVDEIIALPSTNDIDQPERDTNLSGDSSAEHPNADALTQRDENHENTGSIPATEPEPANIEVEFDAEAGAVDDAEAIPVSSPDPDDDGEAPVGEQVGPEGELAAMSSDSVYANAARMDEFDPSIEPDIEDAADNERAGFENLEDDDFEPAGWSEVGDAESDSGEPVSSMNETNEMNELSSATATSDQTLPDAGQGTAAIERATALVDELRVLLPHLAAPPVAAAPSVDLTALREQIAATRDERSFDDFSALREVIAEAINRPRDIEVVLRLSQRVDDIEALLKERDRLDAALKHVLERIGE